MADGPRTAPTMAAVRARLAAVLAGVAAAAADHDRLSAEVDEAREARREPGADAGRS